MAILATILATTSICEPFDEWKYKSIWHALYEGEEERSNHLIEQQNNCLYQDQVMKLFMKAYLIYRIEVKTGKQNPDEMKKAFNDIDTFVEGLLWLD